MQWGNAVVHIKETVSLIGQNILTSWEMSEVVTHTAEPTSTKEDTEIMVKTIDNAYTNVDLEQVTENAVHMNSEERNKLLGIIK